MQVNKQENQRKMEKKNLPVLGIPASEAIKDIETLTGVEVVDSTLVVDQEGVLSHLGVDRAPPDILGGRLLIDNTLILGRATSLLSGRGDKGTSGGDGGTRLVAEGILVELSDGGVAEEVDAGVVDTVLADGSLELGVVLVDRSCGGLGHFVFVVCEREREGGERESGEG
jgi:hypothetical protein